MDEAKLKNITGSLLTPLNVLIVDIGAGYSASLIMRREITKIVKGHDDIPAEILARMAYEYGLFHGFVGLLQRHVHEMDKNGRLALGHTIAKYLASPQEKMAKTAGFEFLEKAKAMMDIMYETGQDDSFAV